MNLEKFDLLHSLQEDLVTALAHRDDAMDLGQRAGAMQALAVDFLLGGLFLREKTDQVTGLAGLLDQFDRFAATDEDRQQHARQDDGVAQRNDWHFARDFAEFDFGNILVGVL